MRLWLSLVILLAASPLDAQQRATYRRQLANAAIHRDLAYVENGHERQKLDLFVPKDASGGVPVIVWIHGGGWQAGGKENCPPLRAGYVAKGYAVASINYRLSQHAVFPAQIDDCVAAIRWLKKHAGTYGLDTDRFGVWGASAGGHLAALVGTRGDGGRPIVRAVCDFYGPTDFEAFVATPGYERHAATASPESRLFGGLVSERGKLARSANPIRFVDAGDPPFLIVHGGSDPVVPLNQSELLAEALKKSGVPVELEVLEDAGHGGPAFQDPATGNRVEGFFAKHLKPAG